MNEYAQIVCPHCGHSTLTKPEGWVEGGPLVCTNPLCDTNHPPEQNHWDSNGDLVVVKRAVFRHVGWRVNGGVNDGLLTGKEIPDTVKSVPMGGFSPVYVEVGD